MPRKTKEYPWTKFAPEVIEKAEAVMMGFTTDDDKKFLNYTSRTVDLSQTEKWALDTNDEFFAEYRRTDIDHAKYDRTIGACSFDVSFYGQYFGRARSQVVVTA